MPGLIPAFLCEPALGPKSHSLSRLRRQLLREGVTAKLRALLHGKTRSLNLLHGYCRRGGFAAAGSSFYLCYPVFYSFSRLRRQLPHKGALARLRALNLLHGYCRRGGALLLPTMKFKQIPTAGGVNPSPTLPNYIFGMGCLGLCRALPLHYQTLFAHYFAFTVVCGGEKSDLFSKSS